MQKVAEEKPREWLVTSPEGVSFNDALTAACGGNKNLQKLLNYFLFHAHLEAKSQKLEPKSVEHITIYRSQDQILQALEKNQSLKTTKKTLIAWVLKLQNYNYLQADARRQAYHLNIKAIKDGIATPPEPEIIPRGRYASNSQKVKTTICSFNDDSQKVKTTNQAQIVVSELELQINLLTEKVNSLQLQIVDLQIVASSEAAKRAELEGKFESLYSKLLDITNTSNTSKEESNAAKADTVPSLQLEQEEVKVSSSGKKPGKSSSSKIVSLQEHKEKAAPPAFATEREQEIYNAWAGAAFFNGNPPKITDTLRGHIATISEKWTHLPTSKEITQCRDWVIENKPEFKHRSYHLGNLINDFPDWLNATYKAPATTSKQSTQTTLFEQPAESSAPEPEQKDAGPDLVYWTLDGKTTSQNWLTWGWMPFEQAQTLNLKYKTTAPNPLRRDTIQSKKATVCSNLGILDEFIALSKEDQWKPLVDWVKQFQVSSVTA